MHEVKDIKLAPQGRNNLELAESNMGALMKLREEFKKNKPFKGYKIGIALHVTKETGVLVRTLIDGGADIAIASCNPLSTQDDIAAALADEGVNVFAYKGETREDYYKYIRKVVEFGPDITVDDGADLVSEIHENHPQMIDKLLGGSEETTTGIIRLESMARAGELKYPVVAVNNNKTKHLMDNFYGTGQSTLDAVMRATNFMFAGKVVVVCGYGSCGKGVALRADGLGAEVVVTEVDNFRALQARMDGYRVLPMDEAAKIGDLFVTVTGNKAVIRTEHMKSMRNGAIMCNSGHFDIEIDKAGLEEMSKSSEEVRTSMMEYELDNGKRLYLLGEGRLVNLAAAEGHPSEVMSLSFCGQALACKYLVDNKGKLEPGVIELPEEIDDYISGLQLEAMGIKIDKLTPEQIKYLNSWNEGT
jgi:adenosylhomocysteinase